MVALGEENERKRKLQDVAEIEIDVSAPEPPSKKILRKTKKKNAALESSESPVKTRSGTLESLEDRPDSSNQRSAYGIWIGNLAFSITKDDLREFLTRNCSFSDSAITRVHLPSGPAKHGKAQNKGFAYIDFSNSKALKETIGLSEQLLSGRPVLIKDANNFQGRPEKSQQGLEASSASAGADKPPSRRIFVGNLGFDATKEVIEQHFGRCGTITNVHIATFEDTGKCKGYGWVEFDDFEAATAAVNGFVRIEGNGDSADEESTSESANNKPVKTKKPKFKKVWVNRLLGRQLRMEFAEDQATRYKKRFGKEGKNRDASGAANTQTGKDATFRKGSPGAQQSHHAKHRPTKAKQDFHENSRYSKETVQRLSGAIVESQGKKTMFD